MLLSLPPTAGPPTSLMMTPSANCWRSTPVGPLRPKSRDPRDADPDPVALVESLRGRRPTPERAHDRVEPSGTTFVVRRGSGDALASSAGNQVVSSGRCPPLAPRGRMDRVEPSDTTPGARRRRRPRRIPPPHAPRSSRNTAYPAQAVHERGEARKPASLLGTEPDIEESRPRRAPARRAVACLDVHVVRRPRASTPTSSALGHGRLDPVTAGLPPSAPAKGTSYGLAALGATIRPPWSNSRRPHLRWRRAHYQHIFRRSSRNHEYASVSAASTENTDSIDIV